MIDEETTTAADEDLEETTEAGTPLTADMFAEDFEHTDAMTRKYSTVQDLALGYKNSEKRIRELALEARATPVESPAAYTAAEGMEAVADSLRKQAHSQGVSQESFTAMCNALMLAMDGHNEKIAEMQRDWTERAREEYGYRFDTIQMELDEARQQLPEDVMDFLAETKLENHPAILGLLEVLQKEVGGDKTRPHHLQTPGYDRADTTPRDTDTARARMQEILNDEVYARGSRVEMHKTTAWRAMHKEYLACAKMVAKAEGVTVVEEKVS